MSIAAFSLAEPAIAQGSGENSKKPPPKRHTVALADIKLIPEPR